MRRWRLYKGYKSRGAYFPSCYYHYWRLWKQVSIWCKEYCPRHLKTPRPASLKWSISMPKKYFAHHMTTFAWAQYFQGKWVNKHVQKEDKTSERTTILSFKWVLSISTCTSFLKQLVNSRNHRAGENLLDRLSYSCLSVELTAPMPVPPPTSLAEIQVPSEMYKCRAKH